MARPGKAPTSARAAKATKNKVEKPASSATTLDENLPDAKRRRQLARRDTEAQVDRAMVSIHFKHISPVTLANRIVDGRTLRETLRDISHSLSPGQRIGSSTYAALARKYADGESVIENLRPTDPTTPLDDECLKLLFAADAEIGVGKAHKALMARLESCAAMSEKMVIGVVKALLNSKVLAKAGSEHLVLALMKYFERRNWHDIRATWPLIYQACLPAFDRAISAIYVDLKKSHVQLSTFCQLYKGVITQVVDDDDLQAVMDHANDLSACSPAVCRIVNSSSLGAHMLSDKMASLTARQLSDKIDGIVGKLQAGDIAISEDRVKAIIEECRKVGDDTTLGLSIRTRTVIMDFLGSKVSIVCADVMSECIFKVSARLKLLSWGTKSGLLVLPYEAWIKQVPAKDTPCPLGAIAMMTEADSARKLANDLLADPSINTFVDMRSILKKKCELLAGMDKTFMLELSWLDGAAEALEKSVLQQTLMCLPAEDRTITFVQSLAKLAAHRKSDMVQRSSAAAKERVASVEAVVRGMSSGVAPAANPGLLAGFYNEVLNQASHFFMKMPEGSSTAVPLTGKAAVTKHIDGLSALMDAKQDIALGDIEKVKAFWWLLTPAQEGLMQILTKHALEALKSSRVLRKVSDEPAGSVQDKSRAQKQRAAQSSKMDTSKANILKFFA